MVGIKQWTGPEDGLPTVGTVCQCCPVHDWYDCEIVANKDDHAVAWINRVSVHALKADKFRPIQSPEDKAVEEMVNIMAEAASPLFGGHELARALYRSGYRKLDTTNPGE